MTLPHQVSQFIEEKMAEYHIPGISVGILHQGNVTVQGFGITSVDNPLPVTPETLFQVGSNTKTMTATVLMILAENGRLDLNAPIREILPDFKVQDPTISATATVRQLLTHSTGWVGDHFIETGAGADAKEKYVQSMADLPQLVPPDFAFSYNNSAFVVAGLIIEKVTGMLYETAVQQLLFEPLGMKNSFFDMADVMIRRFAVGHHIMPDNTISVASPWPLPRALYSAGAVTASAHDMLTYAQFYLYNGKANSGQQLLSPTAIERLWTPLFAASSASGSVAHSWFVQDEAGFKSYSHGGATVGQFSAFKIVPEKQFTFVSFTNGGIGRRFNLELEQLLLTHYCQIQHKTSTLINASPEQLAELVGLYQRPMDDFEFSLVDGQLTGQVIPKQGFPTKETPPQPPSPLFPCTLISDKEFMALDGPMKGAEGQILRREDGSIGWLRFGKRLHEKSGSVAKDL